MDDFVWRVGTAESTTKEVRGSVLDVIRELLGDHTSKSAVLEVVAQLVSRNKELELLLTKARAGKHYNERVAKEQLDLFLTKLREASETTLATANEKLEEVASEHGGRTEPTKPPKQPPVVSAPVA